MWGKHQDIQNSRQTEQTKVSQNPTQITTGYLRTILEMTNNMNISRDLNV